jgi:hypothetical protein
VTHIDIAGEATGGVIHGDTESLWAERAGGSAAGEVELVQEAVDLAGGGGGDQQEEGRRAERKARESVIDNAWERTPPFDTVQGTERRGKPSLDMGSHRAVLGGVHLVPFSSLLNQLIA